MRKKFRIIFALTIVMLLWVMTVSGNDIDQLTTIGDVNSYLLKLFPKLKDYGDLLDASKPMPKDFGKNKFYKLDLDGNGRTDLLIDGTSSLAVLDYGSKDLRMEFIDRGAFDLSKFTIVGVRYEDKTPLIVVKNYDERDAKPIPGSSEKVLVFKFGGFVEYNSKPDNLKVKRIKFGTSGCFGSCPVYDLSITQDGSATYVAKRYNKVQEGTYKDTIAPEALATVIETINYLNLSNLKNEYSVPWTDDQASTLEVTYDSGMVKKISDYGMIGTFGLTTLYQQLASFRSSRTWERISNKVN